ncbi:MAG: hypothetical protein U1F42_11390 [Candidatus Competibacteraceae bacterium]
MPLLELPPTAPIWHGQGQVDWQRHHPDVRVGVTGGIVAAQRASLRLEQIMPRDIVSAVIWARPWRSWAVDRQRAGLLAWSTIPNCLALRRHALLAYG